MNEATSVPKTVEMPVTRYACGTAEDGRKSISYAAVDHSLGQNE